MSLEISNYTISDESWRKYDTSIKPTLQTNGGGAAMVAASSATAAYGATTLVASNMAAAAATAATTASAATVTFGATAGGAVITGGVGATATAGAGAFTTAAASSAIPVAGWIVAAVAVIVGSIQVATAMADRISQEKVAKKIEIVSTYLKRDYELMLIVGQARIDENDRRISKIQKELSYQKKTQMATASMLGIMGLLVSYEVYKQTR